MKYPVQVFTETNALLGYDDRYTSSLLNQKYAGWPRGVHVGFTPVVVPLNPVLSLIVDPVEGYSLLKVPSNNDPGGMDVMVTTTVTLDFTGHLAFPVQVVARVNYSVGAATTAELITRTPAAIGWDEVLVCEVSGSALALIVAYDPNLGQRTAPLALAGVDFGYMPAGSIETLVAAADAVNEVVAARVGLDAVTYPSLSARLAADYGATAMGNRLARALRVLRGNDCTIAAGATSVNVSGSFSEVNRDFNPRVTLDGTGAETSTGAVAAPVDDTRNVANVQDALTGQRPIDAANTRNIIFGRIDGPSVIPLAGTLTFTTAQVDVSGLNTQFTSDIQVGDTLGGPDGRFYEVLTILNSTSLVLRNAYIGPTASGSAINARRWLLRLRKISGGVESAAALTVGATLRFYFPVFLTLGAGAFDYTLAQLTPNERPELPAATTTVEGRGLLATVGALTGAVFVQNAGVPLAGGPFHTLDFTAASAAVAQTSPGEASVLVIGSQGAAGAPGVPGGPGAVGPVGPGFSALQPWKLSSTFTNPTWPAPPTIPVSYQDNMGLTVRYVTGGMAQFRDVGGLLAFGVDYIELNSISVPVATDGLITGTLSGDGECRLFLAAAGD